ncbi:MAG: hypothetical protein C0410_10750 [Anaerolinea sp.]|nr:hypothetical protein [Anaerolinea sp.]
MAIPPKLPEHSVNSPVMFNNGGIVPTRKKIFFWIILAVLSVIFAEVTCFSSPYPFFDGWGLMVVLPLYGLHILFLAGVIFRNKSISLPILLLAGLLFGLYEAPITKVLWDPTWGGKETMFAGIAWLQTSVLTLFWHPWFAFILPLLFGESLFSSTQEVFSVLSKPVRKILGLVLLALFCGINQGANSPSVPSTLISTAQALGVFLSFSLLCKLILKHTRYRLRDLLPKGKELIVLGVLLLIFYIAAGFLIRPEAFPHGLGPYLTILGIYLTTGILLWFNLKKSNPLEPVTQTIPSQFPWPGILLFVLVFIASSILFSFFKSTASMLILITWVLGILIGLGIVINSIFISIRSH